MAEEEIEIRPTGKGMLAQYAGARPPAPDWYRWSIDYPMERRIIDRDGIGLELLTWGTPGKPGLIFIHGNSAHADWWSHLIPFFADDYRCAAVSFAGMGGSGWAEQYTFRAWGLDILAAIDAAGFADGGQGTIIIAHSMGGHPSMHAAMMDERISGIICVDTVLFSPEQVEEFERNQPPGRPHRVFDSLAEPLSRFGFWPAQSTDHPYLVDHIARRALKEVVKEDGSIGWTWCFDPHLWDKAKRGDANPSDVECPMIFMLAGAPTLISQAHLDYMTQVIPPDVPVVWIPEAAHHVMVDQPMPMVAALRTALASWPPAVKRDGPFKISPGVGPDRQDA